MQSSYRLAVDVGGTFTDFALLDEASGEVHIAKSVSYTHLTLPTKA